MAQGVPSQQAFGERMEEELGRTPLELDVRRNAFYSEAEWDVFEVSYSSLGGYRLSAWLSVPRADGPFPGLVQMPDYGSGVDIPFTSLRHGVVLLNASHRGQRGSDIPFQAQYPGLLTHGIDRPDSYVLRGVYADALRAVDLLLDWSSVDPVRIAVAGVGLGGTMALSAGAFRPQVKALAVDVPIMVGPPEVVELADAYPLEELNDYLRTYPQQREAVRAALEVYSPLGLARRVTCPVLLSFGDKDHGQCPPPMGEELGNLLKNGEIHRYPGGSEGGGLAHALLRTRWLRGQLGLT